MNRKVPSAFETFNYPYRVQARTGLDPQMKKTRYGDWLSWVSPEAKVLNERIYCFKTRQGRKRFLEDHKGIEL